MRLDSGTGVCSALVGLETELDRSWTSGGRWRLAARRRPVGLPPYIRLAPVTGSTFAGRPVGALTLVPRLTGCSRQSAWRLSTTSTLVARRAGVRTANPATAARDTTATANVGASKEPT